MLLERRKAIMMRKPIVACSMLLSLLAAGLNGCAASESEDVDGALGAEGEGGEEEIGTAELALTGTTPVWTLVADPGNVYTMTATTTGELYALKWDHEVWLNRSGGANWLWDYLSDPKYARDIAATGPYGSGSVYVLRFEQQLLKNSCGGGAGCWTHVDTPTDAAYIGGGTSLLAVNVDDSVWRWNDAGRSWSRIGAFTGATEISVTSSRYWVLTENGRIFHSADTRFGSFTELPVPDDIRGKIHDISASGNDVLWVHTDPWDDRLFKVTFPESNCKDGVDNDRDGASDGFDPDCTDQLGADVCRHFARDGDFCVNRLYPGHGVVACDGRTYVAASWGECVQVGAGGRDHIEFPD
ncbi:hypothetical protein [Sorangium sp. So ce1335]|uniref:hypothetical protein n=1 Tax=Sorangium sp. So ce1335 TaxID=3133335 RepID=UPI003F5EFE47